MRAFGTDDASTFFGRDALTNTSAAGLALKTGASLVLARGERLPDARYRITVYDPLESPIPDAPVKDQAVALTGIIHGYFERWIREYPEQWICLKRRWPVMRGPQPGLPLAVIAEAAGFQHSRAGDVRDGFFKLLQGVFHVINDALHLWHGAAAGDDAEVETVVDARHGDVQCLPVRDDRQRIHSE